MKNNKEIREERSEIPLMHFFNLNNTATIGVHRKCCNLATESRNNEPNFLRWDTLNAFLYYMIAILIAHTSHDMPIQFMDKLCFLFKLNNFKCLIYHRIKVNITLWKEKELENCRERGEEQKKTYIGRRDNCTY